MRSQLTRFALCLVVVVSGWLVHQVSRPSSAAAVTCGEVINIGHRGAGPGPNENTIPHLAKAAREGVDAVEFDVRRTSDGALAIMHDRTVNRTTDGWGKVARHRWWWFHALRTAAGYHPPSLPLVVREMAPLGVGLQIHLKVDMSAARLASVGRLLGRHGFSPENVQFNSESLRLLARVRRVTGFPTGYTYMGRPTTTRLSRVARSGTEVAVLQQGYVTSRWVAYAARRGLELGARGVSISQEWAARVGVRRLVVDDPRFDCDDPEVPPPTPTEPVGTSTPVEPTETPTTTEPTATPTTTEPTETPAATT